MLCICPSVHRRFGQARLSASPDPPVCLLHLPTPESYLVVGTIGPLRCRTAPTGVGHALVCLSDNPSDQDFLALRIALVVLVTLCNHAHEGLWGSISAPGFFFFCHSPPVPPIGQLGMVRIMMIDALVRSISDVGVNLQAQHLHTA
uniref:Uncharacterized protein n=1 Tax=Eutreptiella gymnastica TaxID=73025 RepID=A0A7S4G9E8_9EUGL